MFFVQKQVESNNNNSRTVVYCLCNILLLIYTITINYIHWYIFNSYLNKTSFEVERTSVSVLRHGRLKFLFFVLFKLAAVV